ncbi:hypothetical protein ACHHYP_02465 [Achlya hypogyna]|uniref:Secreted protein n=1 Tax=Achlya hypogyna TaxID=1202772 RepID=A0A1V9Z6H0_ACHHY|nr:hypothetical protein ACHHYP_02465 [Achlya hypogyna]
MSFTFAIGLTLSFLSSLMTACAANTTAPSATDALAKTRRSHVELSRQQSFAAKRTLSKSVLTASMLMTSEYLWLIENLERLVHHATMFGLDMTTGAVYLKRLKAIRNVVQTKPNEICQWLPLLEDIVGALNDHADDFKRMDLWYQVIECDTVMEDLRDVCQAI